jgi:hypothetical protein
VRVSFDRAPVLALLATSVLLATCAIALLRMDPILVRSSWIARLGEPSDFAWTPDSPPATFRLDSSPASPEFLAVANQLGGGGGDLEAAKGIARYIAQFIRRRPDPIQRGATETLREMREGGLSYCSDVSQVLMGFAGSQGLFAREWAVFFGGFGGRAHVFDEIFDRQRKKWVMVDALNSFVPADVRTGEPLSFQEFRQLLATGSESDIRIDFLAHTFFATPAEAFSYYRPGLQRVGITWGNAKFSNERGLVFRALNPVSVRAEQLARIAMGIFPELVVVPTGVARSDFEELGNLRRRSLALLGVAAVGLALLPLELLWLARSRKGPRERDPSRAEESQLARGESLYSAREKLSPSPTRTARTSSRPNSE